MTPKEITDRHQKAVRYMENAREILRTQAGIDEELYLFPKPVKTACDTAYKAALLALDTRLKIKGTALDPKSRDLADYRKALSDDKEMFNNFHTVWNIIHCGACQNGMLNAQMIEMGLEAADDLIKAVEPST